MLFSGLFLPVLIGLGLWQLDRAGQKQALLDHWQQAQEQGWGELARLATQAGQPVTLTGRYRPQTWLLDNRTRDGVPGYEVLTAFQPINGPPAIVNRGWVPAPRTRTALPELVTPTGLVTLSGRLSDYPEPPVLADNDPQGGSWPRRVQALSLAEARTVLPAVPEWTVRLADEAQPGAYRADWAPDLMGPQTHYGYASQWFALALALTILTVAASYRKTGADNDNDNG